MNKQKFKELEDFAKTLEVRARHAQMQVVQTNADLVDFTRILTALKESEKPVPDLKKSTNLYYTREEVMAMTRHSYSCMSKWAKTGFLVPTVIGGRCLYSKESVDAIIKK